MMKKFTIFASLFFSTTLLAFAANDVHVVDITNFNFLTSDSAQTTTITAAAGGQVTNFNVESSFIDVTLENLSTVTFNVTEANRYFVVTLQSGSSDYTLNPACPTTSVTMTGTGAQVILRLRVQTTPPVCGTTPIPPPPPPSGGGGGGAPAPPPTPPTVPPTTLPAPPLRPSAPLSCSRTSLTAITFVDIAGHWAESFIGTLYRRCIIDGKTPTIFEPDSEATRAELVKIVLNTYNLGTAPFKKIFLDVFNDDWFSGYVTNSAILGIVVGYVHPDGTSSFKPNQSITRAEALKVMLTTKGITDYSGFTTDFWDVHRADWHYKYVAYSQAKNILEGFRVLQNRSGLVSDFYSFPRTLKLGDKGSDVQSLKAVLTDLGFYHGSINEIFDQELKDSLIAYQKARLIKATAVVPLVLAPGTYCEGCTITTTYLVRDGILGSTTIAKLLTEHIDEHERKEFRPNTPITRAEISKIDLLVEQLKI